MTETNNDWRKGENGFLCSKVLKGFWNESVVNMSSSIQRTGSSNYQPGGTLTIAGEPWAARTTKGDNDSDLGRWNVLVVQGRKGRNITIITAYRTVKNNIGRAGPYTAYAQQWHLLNRTSSINVEPRTQMIKDLSAIISKARQKGHGIVLAIDANDSLEHFNNDFTNWIRESDLVDAHTHMHGTEGEPPTHARGSQRIDYILVSEDVAPYIVHAGILPLMEFHHSDHRALYIDLDMTKYLRGHPHFMHKFGNKGLVSSDPRAVQKYRNSLEIALQACQLPQRVSTLTTAIDRNGFDGEYASELEALEQEFTNLRLEAERKCKQIYRLPWSPQLRDAQNVLRFWRMSMSEKRNNIDFSVAKQRVWNAGFSIHQQCDTQTIQTELRKAQRTIRDMGLNAQDLRQAHLEERATLMALEGRMDKAKAITNIIRAEHMREVNRKLTRLFQKHNRGGLTHVLIENEEGGHECIDEPDEINRCLIDRNKRHFSQAEGTPFTIDPLFKTLGPYGTNAHADKLLAGTFDIENLDVSPATKSILRHLRRALPVGAVHSNISPDDVRNGMKKWRETTSVSPSGLHLGHDKATLRMEHVRGEENGGKRLSDTVLLLQSTFINRAIKHTHVYQRWKNIVNATIEKIPGRPLIEKLRVIHIIESDLNLTFGILFGRRMMAAAETASALGSEQFGSRAEKTPVIPLLAKHCKFAIARMTQTNIASFDNDAKSCYDRIVMLLASLCAQRLGVDPSVCKLFLKTLEQTNYRVKTKHGISEESYQTDEASRIHGPGQGARASPGIWAIISCLLMECIREKSSGITMVSPDLLEIITFFTTGFVDDITLWIGELTRSLRDNDNPTTLLQEMTAAAQWWEQLLYATGGKLELSKCFYYLITWTFDEEGVGQLSTLTPQQKTINLQDSSSKQSITIQSRSSHESHKTLGVMMNPSGDGKDELQRIKEKALNLSRVVSSANLSPQEAIITLNTRIIPAISYGLAVGALTEQQAHKIQGTCVRPLLRRMGYNMNTPINVVYAPTETGGIGCKHLFAEQGRQQVTLLIQQVRMGSQTGHLAIAMLKWAQRCAGTSRPLLEAPGVAIPHLTSEPYLTQLRRYLHLSKAGVHIPGITPFKSKRIGDRMVMDIATNRKPPLTKRTLERINRCRTYLRVESMADIVTPDGKRISSDVFECAASARLSPESLWPKQPKIGPLHKRTWHWFLSELCTYRSKTGILLKPLGEWLQPPLDYRWEVMYDDCTDSIFTEYNGIWRIGDIVSKTLDKWIIQTSHHTVSAEEVQRCRTKIPLMYKHLGQGIIETTPPSSRSSTWLGPVVKRYPRTWKSYCNSLPECDRDVLRHCEAVSNGRETLFKTLLDESETITITTAQEIDGARGAFAWILRRKDVTLGLGQGHARGTPMSVARATLYGKLSWRIFLFHYATYFDIKIRCRIIPYSDEKETARMTTFAANAQRTYECRQPDYDAMTALCQAQERLGSIATGLLRCRFVKCKQSAKRKIESLNRVEYQQHTTESAVASFVQKIPNTKRRSPTIPWYSCPAYLLHGQQPYTSNEQYLLRWSWRSREFKQYLAERWNTRAACIETIDWDSMATTRKRMGSSLQIFSTKLLIGWLATGNRMEMYGHSSDACMKCGQREDTDHLLRCPHDGADWEDTISSFSEYLNELNTQPAIVQTMTYGMTQWLNNTTTPGRAHRLMIVDWGKGQQTTLGWQYFMRGILTQDWGERQLSFLRQNKPSTPRRAAIIWSSKVSLWLINDAHRVWKLRNQLVHATSDPNSGHISREESNAAAQVRELYGNKENGDWTTRTMMEVTEEETLQRPLRSLVTWIKATKDTVRARASIARKVIARTHRDISSYWQPSETQTLHPTTQRTVQTAAQEVTRPKTTATLPTAGVRHQMTKDKQAKKGRERPKQRREPVETQQGEEQQNNTVTRKAQGGLEKIKNHIKKWKQRTLHHWNAARIEREGGGSQAKTAKMK